MNGVVFASFLPRLPEIRGRIGVDTAGLGLLLTLGVAGGLVASAICGRVVERLGSRTAMTAAALGLAATLPLIGYAPDRRLFLAALVALQFFDVLTDVPMNIVASRLSARRSVPVMNRLHGLWSVGTVTGGLAASVLAARISLQVHLIAVGIVLAAAVAYVRRGLPSEQDAPLTPDSSDSSDERAVPAGRGLGRIPVLFGLMGLAAIIIESVPAEWAAIRMTDDLGAGATTAGLAYVATTCGMVVGRFGGDHATARLGGSRLTRLAIITSAAGTAAATLVPSVPVALAGFAIAGVGAAVIFPRLYDEAARAPGRPGATLGAMSVGIRSGALVAPVSVGALAATASVDVGMAMAALVITAAAAGLVIRERASLSVRPRSPAATGAPGPIS